MMALAIIAAMLGGWLILDRASTWAFERVRIYTVNWTVAEHVAEVAADMRRLGVPVLWARRVDDGWELLEGSHRMAAAVTLGLGVVLREAPPDIKAGDVSGLVGPTLAPIPRDELLKDHIFDGDAYDLPARRVRVIRLPSRR